jgi:g-D-glutamyl-meso-diaminopimelate peptidase
MKFTHNSRKRMTKKAAAGCLCLSLAFMALSPIPAWAGPAGDIPPAATVPDSGSGSGPAGPGSAAPLPDTPPAVDDSFYNQTITDPIVHPVDKYTYEQMEQDILALAARYPGRINYQVIGQTLDGRNIYDIIIGNPGAQKKILFQGAIHGREYIVVPLMMQQIEYLLAFQDTGSYLGQPLNVLMGQTAIHFVPMTNPDGVALSQFGEGAIRSPELQEGIRAMYAADVAEERTTLPYEQYLVRWKSNARGVDLNHNFNADWEALNPTLNHGSSSDFKGSAPLSEPETQALANVIAQNGFLAVINYHAMGQVLYWDTQDNKKAAESYDMAVTASGVTGYQILGSKGVGGLKDWLQRESSPIAGITIEVGRSACPVAFSEYPTIWEQNKQIPILFCHYILTH